jgi:hypothetical protein
MSSGAEPRHAPHEIALAEVNAISAQDRLSHGVVEGEVGEREVDGRLGLGS